MAKRKELLFRLRQRDTEFGVTRETLGRLAHQLGLSETDVIHKALADCAMRNLPRYAPDEGPLTDAQHAWIAKRVKRQHGSSQIVSRLFEASGKEPKSAKKARSSTRTR